MFFEQSNDENTFVLDLNIRYDSAQEIFPKTLFNLSAQESLDEVVIPCSVFRQGLSGLEAITKYLKEQKNLSYCEIASLLNRDQRTIWTTYNKSLRKLNSSSVKNLKFKDLEKESFTFSSSIIKNRRLSVLESVVVYLRNRGLSISDISQILGRNIKTIWTVLHRANKKSSSEGWKND